MPVARIWEGRTRESIADTTPKPHHLPKDAEYLLELPQLVKHYEIVFDE